MFDDEYVDEWTEGVSKPEHHKRKKKHIKPPQNGGITQFLSKNKKQPQKEVKSLG